MPLKLCDKLMPFALEIKKTDGLTAKTKLIAAGERLLGARGIELVPLHDIATAAGQSNKYAVQYHFGSREGLIKAVFEYRVPAIEARQRQLVHRARAQSLLEDVAALLELVFLPIAEQMDAGGSHTYARFLLQYITQPSFDHSLHHPLAAQDDPVGFVYGELATLLGMADDQVMRRMYLSTLVFLGALIERDNAIQCGRSFQDILASLAETISVMVAIFHASSEGLTKR